MGKYQIDTFFLENIINEKIPENQYLEYKNYPLEPNNKFSSEAMNNILEEIVSFANAEGGTIIIGIETNKIPISIKGYELTDKQTEEIKDSLSHKMPSMIIPLVNGVNIYSLDYNYKKILIIDVPKSYNCPHSFYSNHSKYEYKKRNGATTMYMSPSDLKISFSRSFSIQDQIRDFIKNRTDLLKSEELFLHDSNCFLQMYVIPFCSFENYQIDIDDHRIYDKISLSLGDEDKTYNIDGIMSSYKESYKTTEYLQLFRNGIVEYYNSRYLNEKDGTDAYYLPKIHNYNKFEKKLYRILLKIEETIKNIPKPWYIIIRINGALNRKISYDLNDYGEIHTKIDRNLICSSEGIFNEDATLIDSIAPVFNSLANSIGAEKSILISNIINHQMKNDD